MKERKWSTGNEVRDLSARVVHQGRAIAQRRQHVLKVPWEAVEDLLRLDYPWFHQALAPPADLEDAEGFMVSAHLRICGPLQYIQMGRLRTCISE